MATMQFNVAASTDDGYVTKQGATYPPDAAAGSVTMSGDTTVWIAKDKISATSFQVICGLLKFDTSALPDSAAVTGATLRANITQLVSDDAKSFVADWYTWTGVVADYTSTAGTNAHAGTALSGLTLFADADFVLTNADTNVSKTGMTYLRGHLSDGTPAGRNYFGFADFEHTTATECRLIVTYQTNVQTIAPDAILSQTNLTGVLSDISDDPDAADANWLLAP